ncbi:toll-like receptor 2 type-1 [Babylonia areolata]|uniref:toll-like receptor 2 type-1 n=1 Tax=Babylonia areolata TaxID=304850 RepID=UPI003FD68169
MALAALCPTARWLWCLSLLVVLLPPQSIQVAAAACPSTRPQSYDVQVPCGDNRCWCDRSTADCSGHWGQLTYVPKLPESIVEVDFSCNNLSLFLTRNTFANFTSIQTLYLLYNNISWLPAGVFREMGELNGVVLDCNDALTFPSLREIFSIQSIRWVEAQNCNLPPPPADLFQNTTSHIGQIRLSYNPHGSIYNLDGFCNLHFLWQLDLSDCDFNGITSSCSLNQLRSLLLIDNALRTFPKTCIGKESMFPFLGVLNLRHNRIEVVFSAEVCLPMLRHLDLSHNFITVYPTGTFSIAKFPFLQKLKLRNQSPYWFVMPIQIEARAFDNPNLTFLDLRSNGLNFGDDEQVSSYAFANCSNLRDLFLHSNNFTSVDGNRFLLLFGSLQSLVNLKMPGCKFETISRKMFAYFPKLTSLYLYDNMIDSIPDGAFDSLWSLRILLLHNNKIKTINEETFGQNVRSKLSALTLASNPLVCSCDLVWFQHWFQNTGSNLFMVNRFRKTDYKCDNIPGMTLENFSMTEQACLIRQEVNLLIILCCSIFIFTLTLVTLVFRYRWHIRLLMHEAFRGRDVLRRQRLMNNNFDFDVFVSYASEDLPWVRQQLLPKLEDELGLRLCIHERDFVLGRHIVDNIVQCVESSKKILMVFSQHFVHSQWCQFELSLCLSHVMDYDDALIVVCVDNVTSRQMTSAMMGVLKTTTYIQWSEEEDAVVSFWGRLCLALREIIPFDEQNV